MRRITDSDSLTVTAIQVKGAARTCLTDPIRRQAGRNNLVQNRVNCQMLVVHDGRLKRRNRHASETETQETRKDDKEVRTNIDTYLEKEKERQEHRQTDIDRREKGTRRNKERHTWSIPVVDQLDMLCRCCNSGNSPFGRSRKSKVRKRCRLSM